MVSLLCPAFIKLPDPWPQFARKIEAINGGDHYHYLLTFHTMTLRLVVICFFGGTSLDRVAMTTIFKVQRHLKSICIVGF